MAINWGGAASGAMSGAAAGAAFGGWGAPIGAVAGGLLGMFGGSGGQMQQVNPYAAQYWDMMQGNLANYQRQMAGAERSQTGYLGAGQNYFNQLGSFTPQATYDLNAAIRAFNAQAPQLQQLAVPATSPNCDID